MAFSVFDAAVNKGASFIPDLFGLVSDQVKIRNNNLGYEVFNGVGILGMDVMDKSRMMTHPSEEGQPIIDHKIDEPKTVTLNCSMKTGDYASQMEEIRIAKRAGTLFIVQGRGESYFNLALESIPTKASAENFNTLFVTLSFVEKLDRPVTGGGLSLKSVSNPLDSSWVKKGLAPIRANASAQQSSALSSITGFFS